MLDVVTVHGRMMHNVRHLFKSKLSVASRVSSHIQAQQSNAFGDLEAQIFC